ncbi:MAG: glycerol kinase GlpK [Eubacteriales bacterium]|nr:glycerol kinase GlpK [Eubacteriales bacterium]
MRKYIMAMDQGTTSSRCILFDEQGKPASIAQKEFRQIYPKPGWVEHDAMEIWGSQMGVAQEAMHQIGANFHNIKAIGITNQRETTVIWDKITGEPVYNAIVWQCRRTAEFCDSLIKNGMSESFRKKTGLPIDAYFSATKILWILDHVPGARKRAWEGELLFGTIDTWLIWNLTKGRVHATDYSNASRTMLFNINDRVWDPEILNVLKIPQSILPEVKPSCYFFGEADPLLFGGPIPITAAAGDQQAALFGHDCFEAGMAKNTYGTGGFLLMNTGKTPVYSQKGLITTIAWGIDNQVYYALEGSIFVAGAAIQWLRDELKLIEDAKDSEKIAQATEDNNGVYFVPAFVGLGAPYWTPYARGTIVGLTRGANRNHIVRATLESIAYQTYDVVKMMEEEAGIKLSVLKVDGGAAANEFLMQFQSDLIRVPVERPKNTEITALGVANLARLAVEEQGNKEIVNKNQIEKKIFYPVMKPERQECLLKGWNRALRCTLEWAKGENP